MGILYTYAIDRVTGLTYVGKSKDQLESFGDRNFIRPKEVSLSECEVFESLEVVRASESYGKSYNHALVMLYDMKKLELENTPMSVKFPVNTLDISLENVVIHTLQYRNK